MESVARGKAEAFAQVEAAARLKVTDRHEHRSGTQFSK